MPMVSVLVPYYNREKWIASNIDSILNQSMRDWELLLIDDGSTDNSSSIVHTYKDTRIRHIKQNHLGCWKTKNIAIKQARGEWVLFIDSDDTISNDYLYKGLACIRNSPGYDYYYPTRLIITDERGSQQDSNWRYFDTIEGEESKLLSVFIHQGIGGIPHAGALIKRNLFYEQGFYPEEHVNMADTYYTLIHAFTVRFKPCETLLSYYNRQHEEQLNKDMAGRHTALADMIDYVVTHNNINHYLPEMSLLLPNQKIKEACEYIIQLYKNLAESNPDYSSIYLQKAKKYILLLRNQEEEKS